jgi:hypothetical protein
MVKRFPTVREVSSRKLHWWMFELKDSTAWLIRTKAQTEASYETLRLGPLRSDQKFSVERTVNVSNSEALCFTFQ